MNSTDVGTTLRDMWETRPSRPRQDRKVAGVAAALARRYDIDPVLVRVGFVVAAFYGIGIALYLAGWVLLPAAERDDPLDGAATGTTARSSGRTAPPLVLAGLILALLLTSGIFWGNDGSVILPVLAVLVLLFLLHRSRGHLGQRGGSGGADAPTAHIPADGVVDDETAAPSGAADKADGAAKAGEEAPVPDPLDRGTPPAWDPLGAAPFAWDLPEPAQPEPAPAPRRSRVTPITLALALLGGGIAGAVVLLTSGLAGLPVVFATALTVLGVGLVIGAFTRGGRGLIPFALLLAVLTWASLAVRVPLANFGAGVGDIRVAPTVPAALAPSYERGAGTIELDLRRLDLSVPPGAEATPVRTAASVGAGDIRVFVPRDADVTLTGHVDLGEITFDGTSHASPDAELTVTDDLGADGVRSGRPLVLDLTGGAASVEVQRV
ncbi:PspC domain-containing protein [Pseudonocardia yuanmonensis]|uniref:PspC domain-containing protein n=1 Tax=Pseudonocardia yuanmonensis TaxID=1095914 RepID=A0ABP8XKP4_9PSEU